MKVEKVSLIIYSKDYDLSHRQRFQVQKELKDTPNNRIIKENSHKVIKEAHNFKGIMKEFIEE